MSLVILSASEVSTLRSLRGRLSLNSVLNLKCKLHFKVWIFRFLTKAQNDKVLPARHFEPFAKRRPNGLQGASRSKKIHKNVKIRFEIMDTSLSYESSV